MIHLVRHCGWDLLLKSKQPLYRNCISLQLLTDPPCMITLIDSNTYIEVHVDTTASVPRSEYAGHFPIIRQAILNGIRSACSTLNYKTTKPELAFLCPHTSPSPSPPSSTDKPREHTATLTKAKQYWCCDLQPQISGPLDERHSIWFGRSLGKLCNSVLQKFIKCWLHVLIQIFSLTAPRGAASGQDVPTSASGNSTALS